MTRRLTVRLFASLLLAAAILAVGTACKKKPTENSYCTDTGNC